MALIAAIEHRALSTPKALLLSNDRKELSTSLG
jgi:hypothetical protein